MSTEAAWRRVSSGVDVFVRLTPRSSRDAIEGFGTDGAERRHIKARVRAVPEAGAANAALCDLVAKSLGVPKRSVRVEAGATQRLKTLRIEGDPDALVSKLDALVAQHSP